MLFEENDLVEVVFSQSDPNMFVLADIDEDSKFLGSEAEAVMPINNKIVFECQT